ncbi:MAG: hypothetical protein CVU59_03880 [Deltaproteobacteria bacterium HGW-Deltaproteobacteria-17]|nr:MAG: hypothetical protein CVU59_03880 [Deltaproteobacteria bacterium HGW-Deltaproteobacteria-17]
MDIEMDDSQGYFITGLYSLVSSTEIFLSRYGSDGTRLWTSVWGSSIWDEPRSVTRDPAGNVYGIGISGSGIDGNPFGNMKNSFISKYTATGTRLYTYQYNTSYAHDLVVDEADNRYIVGQTTSTTPDAILIKMLPSGGTTWSRTLGSTASDIGRKIVRDGAGNLYIAGTTAGSLGGQTHRGGDDIFLAKYSPDGDLLWVRMWGTSSTDRQTGLALSSDGFLYISGYTAGSFPGFTRVGFNECVLIKVGTDGTEAWLRQWGGVVDSYSNAMDVATSADGQEIFVTGFFSGTLDSLVSNGLYDVFVTKFYFSGVRSWSRGYGTTGEEEGLGIGVTALGDVFAVGYSDGNLSGQGNLGSDDIIVIHTR